MYEWLCFFLPASLYPCVCVFCFFIQQTEAINMLMDLRAKISTQEDFAEIAQEHSDCGSARSGGDLGEFGDGQMMKVCTDGCLCVCVCV